MTVLLLAWSLRRVARPDPVQQRVARVLPQARRARRRALAERRPARLRRRARRARCPRRARAILRIGALVHRPALRPSSAMRAERKTCDAWCASCAWHEARPERCSCCSPLLACACVGQAKLRRARPEVQAFIRDLALKRHGFVEQRAALPFLARAPRRAGARGDQAAAAESALLGGIPRAISSTSSASPAGLEFWRKHRRALERAETQLRRAGGVHRRHHRRRDLLRPQHRPLARGRCAHHARLRLPAARGLLPRRARAVPAARARRRAWTSFAVRGSYAGAIGIPQFMPSSTRRYAVDFDGNGAHRPAPQPGRRHRQRGEFPQGARLAAGGERCCSARSVDRGRLAAARRRLARAELPLGRPARRGRRVRRRARRACARCLVELGRRTSRATTASACRTSGCITRYNRSAFYAAAVSDLARRAGARAQTWASRAADRRPPRPCGSGSAASADRQSVQPSSAIFWPRATLCCSFTRMSRLCA